MRPKDLKFVAKMAIENRMNLMVTGAPGIGKTEICHQVINELGYDCLVMHPVTHDPTVYMGLGFPSSDKTSAEFLPYGNLKRMIDAVDPLVCLLDDAGQASTAVKAAMMQLIQERAVDGKKVSDSVRFILCSNRTQDKAGVSQFLEPLKSRQTIVELEVSDEDWRAWASQAGMPIELIAFSKLRPNLLFDFKPSNDLTNSPCPRNWAEVGKWQLAGVPKHLEYEVFKGRCGEQFAAEYCGFLRTFREMPDPQDWIDDPNKPLPVEDHIKYALCAALSHMASKKNIEGVYKVANRLDAEFAAFMIFDMCKRDPKLAEAKGMGEWAAKNAKYLI